MKKRGDLRRPKLVLHKRRNRGPRATLFFARGFCVCLEDHPELVPAPLLTLAELKTDIEALASAEAAAEAAPVHGRRDKAYGDVVADIDFICAFAQFRMDKDPETAPVIAAHLNLGLGGRREKLNPPFGAKPYEGRPHCVRAFATPTYSRQVHVWAYSIDGGRTYIDAGQTTRAFKILGPFTPGMTLKVRHRSFDSKNKLSDWSQPVEVVVT